MRNLGGARTGLAAGVVALVVSAGPVAAEDFRWEGRVGPGQAVEIKGLNGGIVAGPASGANVEVTATKRVRRGDPSTVKIEAVEHAGGVTVCALYPPATECEPGEGASHRHRGHGYHGHDEISVDFEVRVPAGVRFVGRTVNGRISATGLAAPVDVATVNGKVEVETSAHATARTVNGSVRAAYGSTDWKGTVDLGTVNGSVTVELPESAAVAVKARTVNGSIDTDFPLTVKSRIARRTLSGTIGGGGRDLDIETVNGSIHLVKR